jgi:hypothetical protein
MGALTINDMGAGPESSAPLCVEYPQFSPVPVPEGSDAVEAWIGTIQPFTDDESARGFLTSIEDDRELFISSGTVRTGLTRRKPHWADPLLLHMDVRCKILLLIQPYPAHPRAYLLNPRFPEHYSWVHPHPRFDFSIRWQNKIVPGLCVYSASEFQLSPGTDRNTQFLDQAVLYVARHLIWLRTRQLYRGFPPRGVLLHTPRPGELIPDDRPVVIAAAHRREKPILDYWAGYWAGPVAHAMSPAEHLKSIRPTHECWCTSGLPYGKCHRSPDEIATTR